MYFYAPLYKRILFSSALVMFFGYTAFGADGKTTPPDRYGSGTNSATAKDIELPPETPLGTPIPGKKSAPTAKEPTVLRPLAEPPVSSDPLPEEPQELPQGRGADQPSPLRLEVAAPPSKTKTPSAAPKVLSFKPEADSSNLVDRLKASGKSNSADIPQEKNAPSKSLGGDDDLQPIVEDTPDAVSPDQESPTKPKTDGAKPSAESDAFQPAPDSEDAGPAPLEAASFNGVTPGQSTLEDVEKAWGPPKEMFKQNEIMTQLFSIEPFDRIEVGYENDKVISLIVRFQKPFAANKIAKQLGMADVRPVLISNDMGEIIGQSFPERGVLFAFEPNEEKSKPSNRVSHIMLEPINAEPFILRAETNLDTRYDRSLQDLQVALELQPDNARANWLTARILAAMEQFEKAEAASFIAVQIEPTNVRFCITHAQILGQMGRLHDAILETQKAIDMSADQPHLQARALCLKGDLTASGPKPDYRKAISYHSQALKTADSVSADEHPAVRKAAKEVMVDAHLGSAHDIAWGDWKDKEKAVTMWLKRAAVIAEDLMNNEDGNAEQLFRVHTRALSALVGIRSGTDPKIWLEGAMRTGNNLITGTQDPIRKAQYQWDLGMAIYDAVQICQLRSNHALALKYGDVAVEYLEQGYAHKQTPTTAYLLGRLYFRMGAIHAIRDQDHAAAIAWFKRAVPLLDKPVPPEAQADLGRFGETFVSMGVSFWETGNRGQAIELTKKGISLMEEAAAQGTLDRSALAIPYSNLAAMHRQVGANEEAAKYSEMAGKIKNTKTR
jgi:tetratricopeptide (TPR) repeat protein